MINSVYQHKRLDRGRSFDSLALGGFKSGLKHECFSKPFMVL